MESDIAALIKPILVKIKSIITTGKGGVPSFDFSSATPVVASKAIQQVLHEKGYVSYVVFSNDGKERMYIDLNRRWHVESKK